MEQQAHWTHNSPIFMDEKAAVEGAIMATETNVIWLDKQRDQEEDFLIVDGSKMILLSTDDAVAPPASKETNPVVGSSGGGPDVWIAQYF